MSPRINRIDVDRPSDFYSRFLNAQNVADSSPYILWGLCSLVVLPVDGREVPIIQNQDLIQKDRVT
jgi:hypothetical protein